MTEESGRPQAWVRKELDTNEGQTTTTYQTGRLWRLLWRLQLLEPRPLERRRLRMGRGPQHPSPLSSIPHGRKTSQSPYLGTAPSLRPALRWPASRSGHVLSLRSSSDSVAIGGNGLFLGGEMQKGNPPHHPPPRKKKKCRRDLFWWEKNPQTDKEDCKLISFPPFGERVPGKQRLTQALPPDQKAERPGGAGDE